MHSKLRPAIAFSVLVSAIAACAVDAPIQPAATSESRFAHAAYKGTTVVTGSGSPDSETYRVFVQGATGFVSIGAVREDAEQRARAFCDRKGKAVQSLSETTANPPYILGNFPRIEIVFDCVAMTAATRLGEDPKYTKLANLKRLLDSGALTQAEFDSEKAKILNQP
jgi:Short C-terminal domain